MESSGRRDVRLRVLRGVSWEGAPVPVGRSQALVAALVAARGRVVGEERLVDQVWGLDERPANPAKALQVVVSRARAQTSPDVVVRADGGYRLGLPDHEVDVLALRSLVAEARAAEARGDHVIARDRARDALALAPPEGDGDGEPDGPLGDLRAAADADRLAGTAVLGRALSLLGDHEEALWLLERAPGSDEATLAAHLRSEATVRGAPVALEHYERHRETVRDRLGVDPGPLLQEVHAELLAADSPVRAGLLFEATSLVGRDDDLRALREAVRGSRVTSILGPGGLGKTRLAHLLGREADQPVVHFVELVGVTSPEDVVGEIGSALGVRDSVSGRRALTSEQRGDVRARVAQHLDKAPTLLILDNCEHVVAPVADLVAFLVATCRRLRVVTTTRAPLAIAAERVFPLAQLATEDAADLFCQRAESARPGVRLDPDAVRRVVTRLDGLPLAIELAAAKVRVMSVEDIDRRLDDRFALLRGGDRSAPDRHQTLLAVIDWSWNLLSEGERRALRRLSVFHDGFTPAAADTVLGHDALDEVQSLVDQSLLSVLDAHGSVRYRMLETVREFGQMQLVGAGEDASAREAQRLWATAYATRASDDLWSSRQVDAMRDLLAEENNLADCLRLAVSAGDPVTTAQLMAALGAFWTVKGENPRVFAMAGAVEETLRGWEPAPDQVDVAVSAAATTVMNTMVGELADAEVCLALLERYGDRATEPRVRGMVAVLRAQDVSDPSGTLERLHVIAAGPDREAAMLARMWGAHYRENEGDPDGALDEAAQGLALARPQEDGPWLSAMLHTISGGLNAQLGKHEEAAIHALAALPELDRLEANEDAIQVRSMLAMSAIQTGRLGDAERYLAEIDEIQDRRAGFAGFFAISPARAELALARGDVTEGLRLYRVAVSELRELTFPGLGGPTGLEPWTLFGESCGTTAYAVHATGSDGSDLFDAVRSKVLAVLDPGRPHLDYPVAGTVLHGLGAWGLLREAMPLGDAVRLLVLADLFAYARYTPTMSPDRTDPVAEERAPGLMAEVRGEYRERRGPELLEHARAVAARVT